MNEMCRTSLRRRIGWLAVGVLVCILSSANAAAETTVRQQRNRVYYFIDDPRPVAAAIQELIERYGYVITYEDPPYAYAGDIKDVTEEVRGSAPPDRAGTVPRTLIPLGGSLQWSHAVSANTGRPESVDIALRELLTTQEATGTGGVFRLLRTGDVVHVIPTRVRALNGDWIQVSSILDVPISLAPQSGPFGKMLDAFCAAVSKTAHVELDFSGFMSELFVPGGGVRIQGATGEPARDVLSRILLAMNKRIAWVIFNAPGDKLYVLSLSFLPDIPGATPVPPKPTPAVVPDSPRPWGRH